MAPGSGGASPVADLSALIQVDTGLTQETASAGKQIALASGPPLPQFQILLEVFSGYDMGIHALAKWDVTMCSILAVVSGLFILWSCPDMRGFVRILNTKKPPPVPEEEQAQARVDAKEEEELQKPRSMMTIFGLTFYRFYTGFLSATWLPYLLAMEGAALWRENQALFMGLAKLLYGFSVLLTPLFGLFGDQLAYQSHALGRRLYVRIGIIVAAIGIYLCHWSAQCSPRNPGHYSLFMLGILIWRVGEGFNDVTTEAICPEMLPNSQFQLGSTMRACMNLVGGIVGYVLIMVMAHVPYYWLYHGYLVMMFLCGIPPLLVIVKDIPKSRNRGASRQGLSFFSSCAEAYLSPGRFEGGFPTACMCTFIFCCGSAPMFFLLLMLRDLVGIDDQIQLKRHFGLISIDFFLSAAVAAVLNTFTAPKKPEAVRNGRAEPVQEIRVMSFRITAFAVICFGISAIIMPLVVFFPLRETRAKVFYFLSAALGATFGSVYARFQDCTWQLLPKGVELANAMGYSTMWKLLGAGLGNFLAGLVLDLFQLPDQQGEDPTGQKTNLIAYGRGGYMAVCWGSAAMAFIAGGLVLTIPGRAIRAREKQGAGFDGAEAVAKTSGETAKDQPGAEAPGEVAKAQ